MTKYWMGVVSRQHVKLGEAEGIAQVCHGKQRPLKRIKPGDWIIYYSPTEVYGVKQPYQKFTALGEFKEGEPYQFKMSDDFIPWRRDVKFSQIHEVAIAPLLDKLSFIKNKKQWGYIFRFGLFEIPRDDFQLIAKAMGVNIEE